LRLEETEAVAVGLYAVPQRAAGLVPVEGDVLERPVVDLDRSTVAGRV
jgi:hypothetical protein